MTVGSGRNVSLWLDKTVEHYIIRDSYDSWNTLVPVGP
ncbi:hypothetical protein HNR71_002866 [Kribbella sandramycini]|uniref:Uncharacterized protein n=1 Tax=Kribbella sandramycini TaxID=60450 RepID=A0A841S7K4_9ACTN|nr:hypothetical protein [Kribbella sandramycini]